MEQVQCDIMLNCIEAQVVACQCEPAGVCHVAGAIGRDLDATLCRRQTWLNVSRLDDVVTACTRCVEDATLYRGLRTLGACVE